MKKKIIWIVDDDSIFKIIIQKIISTTEIFENVETFSNGKEASSALKNALTSKNNIPNIILLDLEMPIMDGWDFISEISTYKEKIEELDILIYISSSSIASEDKIKANNNPFIKGFLTKPITVEDLIKITS